MLLNLLKIVNFINLHSHRKKKNVLIISSAVDFHLDDKVGVLYGHTQYNVMMAIIFVQIFTFLIFNCKEIICLTFRFIST